MGWRGEVKENSFGFRVKVAKVAGMGAGEGAGKGKGKAKRR